MPWACFCRAVASFIVACAVARSVWISWIDCLPVCGVSACVTRWLSADTCAAPFGFVVEVVTAENTASVCSCDRIAVSSAWIPYSIFTEESTRAVADPRAVAIGPGLPVYHLTVFAGVPLTSDVGGVVTPVAIALKPSAANAVVFELVTDRPEPLSA